MSIRDITWEKFQDAYVNANPAVKQYIDDETIGITIENYLNQGLSSEYRQELTLAYSYLALSLTTKDEVVKLVQSTNSSNELALEMIAYTESLIQTVVNNRDIPQTTNTNEEIVSLSQDDLLNQESVLPPAPEVIDKSVDQNIDQAPAPEPLIETTESQPPIPTPETASAAPVVDQNTGTTKDARMLRVADAAPAPPKPGVRTMQGDMSAIKAEGGISAEQIKAPFTGS